VGFIATLDTVCVGGISGYSVRCSSIHTRIVITEVDMSDFSPFFDQEPPEIPVTELLANMDVSEPYELDATGVFRTDRGWLVVRVQGCSCWPDVGGTGGTEQIVCNTKQDVEQALRANGASELLDELQARNWGVRASAWINSRRAAKLLKEFDDGYIEEIGGYSATLLAAIEFGDASIAVNLAADVDRVVNEWAGARATLAKIAGEEAEV
jgi:hypothetical protein